MTAVLELCAIM